MASALEFRIKEGGVFVSFLSRSGAERRSNEGTSCTRLLKYAASFSAGSPDLEPHTISVMHSRKNSHQAAS